MLMASPRPRPDAAGCINYGDTKWQSRVHHWLRAVALCSGSLFMHGHQILQHLEYFAKGKNLSRVCRKGEIDRVVIYNLTRLARDTNELVRIRRMIQNYGVMLEVIEDNTAVQIVDGRVSGVES